MRRNDERGSASGMKSSPGCAGSAGYGGLSCKVMVPARELLNRKVSTDVERVVAETSLTYKEGLPFGAHSGLFTLENLLLHEVKHTHIHL